MKYLRKIKTITSLCLIILLLGLPFLSEARISVSYANAQNASEAAFDFAVQINQVTLSTDGRVFRYQGKAEPNTWIKLILKNQEATEVIDLGQVQADQNGNWHLVYQGDKPLLQGSYTAQASSDFVPEREPGSNDQSFTFTVFYVLALAAAAILVLTFKLLVSKQLSVLKVNKQEDINQSGPFLRPKRGPPATTKNLGVFPAALFASLLFFTTLPQKNINKIKLNKACFQAKSLLDKALCSTYINNNALFVSSENPYQFRVKLFNNMSKNSNRLFLAISLMEKPEEFIQLLQDLFSPQELENLVKRFEITELLAKGNSYDQIEKITGVSGGTIAKVSAGFIKNYKGYKISVERITSKNNV